MQEQEKQIQELKAELARVWGKLDMEAKKAEIEKLNSIVAEPELWKNPDYARETHEKLARLTEEVRDLDLLKMQVADIDELITLKDENLKEEIKAQIEKLAEDLAGLKKVLRFKGKYDGGGAIVRITAGAGGTEAMDWAGMLERMYLRFIEKQNMRAQCLERVVGEEAGIKTSVYEIKGRNAYGLLKSEHGVHRLVRLSPFNADNLRQTSFALVEILPVVEEEAELEIAEKDLRVDVYRSGGHGGQSVNTTDSAVRITHLPTGIVVAIQNERSQIQNREKAMEILRGKLIQLQQEQQVESIGELRAGESASWGQQIRNYVMQPYKLVKDLRTKYEETDVEAVLDGKIDNFIEAFLDWKMGEETK